MTVKITVYGIVQGVGFRPFILKLARKFNICGYVKNLGGHVEIVAQADKEALDEFVRRLDSSEYGKRSRWRVSPETGSDRIVMRSEDCLPPGCIILKKDLEWIGTEEIYNRFVIADSEPGTGIMPVISPDVATCSECERELFDREDRRHFHPFISCVSCGPRFSIIEKLPYDRPGITMGDFTMCSACSGEYTGVSDRRCHAQTIACRECGPELKFVCRDGNFRDRDISNGDLLPDDMDEALIKAVAALKRGEIIAVKDIGGYHFACRADSEDAVKRLRELKQREKKPFAVMFPSVEDIKKYAKIDSAEEELILSEARPIVLVKRENVYGIAPSVCGESMDIGAFLPCNPVQLMLMRYCGALVMTSGNISGEPIITDDKVMERLYSDHSGLYGILSHNRRILTPLDDSVIRVIDGRAQFIRRARGYVPLPLLWDLKSVESLPDREADSRTVLALGGDLKAAFCIANSENAVMSQYFGDLEDYDAYKAWEDAVCRMLSLYDVDDYRLVCDMHPEYFSTSMAERLWKYNRQQSGSGPLMREKPLYVQHHHAHIASVMAERQLKGRVLGFAFDGTGFGTDRRVWGGEVMLCENARFERLFHLEYVKLCGGNEAPKNAGLVMCCYLKAAGIEYGGQTYSFAEAALDNDINTFETSSMGRLFDAVSAMLGICGYNEYEGQCAILLEQEALKAFDRNESPCEFELPLEGNVFKVTELVRQIYRAVSGGAGKGAAALGFHIAISKAVKAAALKFCDSGLCCRQAVLSGGVFSNRLLLSMCGKELLEAGFDVYTNEFVPVNDGGIALGQAYIAMLTE